jgi:hypothetical protein
MLATDNPAVRLWFAQFSDDEKPIAQKMLSKFAFVPSDQFQNELSHLASNAFPERESIAFFIEREIPRHWYLVSKPLGKVIDRTRRLKKMRTPAKSGRSSRKVKRPQKMYKEIRVNQGKGLRKRTTASGAALPAVQSPTNSKQQIGSEGIVASVLSKVCDANSSRLFLHPSAELVREKKIRRFVIVTDFIGSGDRVNSMLASLWFVKSIRSWFNAHFIKFSVLCYTGTDAGLKIVSNHRLKPEIFKVRTCPTVFNSFSETESDQVIHLCRKRFNDSDDPLGHKETGALIAFQHSCPINVPAIFVREKKGRRNPWHPLFPARSSASFAFHHNRATSIHTEQASLDALRFKNVGISPAYLKASQEKRHAVVITAALRRGYRALDELSTVTGWPVWIITNALESAKNSGLIDSMWRVTWPGLRLLKRLDAVPPRNALPLVKRNLYYPKLLRAPVQTTN